MPYSLLDAYTKLQKATVSFLMSVYVSVRPRGTTRLPWIFLKFDVGYFFFKTVKKIRVLLKSDKNNGYEGICTLIIYLAEFL
jgi:hypothetical protein